MKYTVFDTPIVRTILYWVSVVCLKLWGWKREGRMPEAQKCVIIAAPHTTNWDMPITLMLAFTFHTRIYWMGKHTLFHGIFGPIMRWLGGIPIDRDYPQGMVQQCIDEFAARDHFILVIPPEGTRGQVKYWKTGFYRIADGAGVPIGLGYLDYARKAGGMGPAFWPTGDIEEDMRQISAFYVNVTPKFLDKYNCGHIRPRETDSNDNPPFPEMTYKPTGTDGPQLR